MTARTEDKFIEKLPSWASSPLIRCIIQALGAGNVRFVGGAVRDTLIGLPVSDVDMATTLTPKHIINRLKDTPVKTIPTGLEHGTVTAVLKGETCEITTLRVDCKTDGRHAVVAFTSDWREDAKRRDFTINALYMASDGKIFDPFNGLEDIKEKRVRFIGNPRDRINEDALRILRFYRFSARYAAAIDSDGQKACLDSASRIKELSIERVRVELLKLLSVPSPVVAFDAMAEAGILKQVFPEGFEVDAVRSQFARDTATGETVSALCRLWLLVQGHYSPKTLSKLLKLSGKEYRILQRLSAANQSDIPIDKMVIHQLAYKFGKEIVEDIVKIKVPVTLVGQMLSTLRDWEIPVLPINGTDLIDRGITEGPELGQRLSELEEAWSTSDFSLTKDQLLRMLP